MKRQKQKHSILRLLLQPDVCLYGVLHFASAFTFGILDVTLALHLKMVSVTIGRNLALLGLYWKMIKKNKFFLMQEMARTANYFKYVL